MFRLVTSLPADFSPRSLLCASFAGLSLLVVGCGGGDDFKTVTEADAEHAEAHGDEHHHEHHAPHGGHLIELGDHKYNAEVVLDPEPKQLVVYLLDAHAENPVAIAAEPLTFEVEGADAIVLEPQPQDADADGTSSRFVAGGAPVESIIDLEDVHGSLKVSIEGAEYAGALSHDHDHDDHEGHDH